MRPHGAHHIERVDVDTLIFGVEGLLLGVRGEAGDVETDRWPVDAEVRDHAPHPDLTAGRLRHDRSSPAPDLELTVLQQTRRDLVESGGDLVRPRKNTGQTG